MDKVEYIKSNNCKVEYESYPISIKEKIDGLNYFYYLINWNFEFFSSHLSLFKKVYLKKDNDLFKREQYFSLHLKKATHKT